MLQISVFGSLFPLQRCIGNQQARKCWMDGWMKRREALSKNSSGTNFRASPVGAKRRDALSNTMAHLVRYPNAQVHAC